jgi:hypothetical protein
MDLDEGRAMADGCRHVCSLPVSEVEALLDLLER